MTNAHIIAAIIGVALSFSIINLVRQDHISPSVAARWFLVSMVVLIVGIAPEIVDNIGVFLGIGYPPIIPVLLAISVALLKILLMDIDKQKQQTKIDRLAQKIAILETKLNDTSTKKTHNHEVLSDKVTQINAGKFSK